MPILEDIARCVPTPWRLHPAGMAATGLAAAKRRIGDRVCMIGGFDQGVLLAEHPAGTRAEVRRLFEPPAAAAANPRAFDTFSTPSRLIEPCRRGARCVYG